MPLGAKWRRSIFRCQFRIAALVKHVQSSIVAASVHSSKLPSAALFVEGFSSEKVRHLLNNLCQFPKGRYLEVGCWKGSTFIAALYGNEKQVECAISIDNWSELGGPSFDFRTNCAIWLTNVPYKFHSFDCFAIDPKRFITDKINVYFYDGAHPEEDKKNAFTHFNDVLDDV